MEVVGISVEVKVCFFGKQPWHKWIYMYRDVCWQGSVFILFSYDTAMYDNELIKSKENTIWNKDKI